jgi:hypothetical protein
LKERFRVNETSPAVEFQLLAGSMAVMSSFDQLRNYLKQSRWAIVERFAYTQPMPSRP